MKKLLLLAVCLFAVALFAKAPNESWKTDFAKAQAEAKAKKLPMYVLFTGSDWCPWCVKMHKNILTQPAFVKATKGKVVLVYLDFPRKSKLPAEEAQKNRELAEKYGIQGFPTVLVMTPEGKTIGKLGYGPVKKHVAQLNKLLKKK